MVPAAARARSSRGGQAPPPQQVCPFHTCCRAPHQRLWVPCLLSAPPPRCSSFCRGLQASDPSDVQAKISRDAAGDPPSLHLQQRRSSPPSGSTRSRSAGGAIRDEGVHVGSFSTEGRVPEQSRAGSSSWGGLSSSPAGAAPQQGKPAGTRVPASSQGSSSWQRLHEPGAAPGSPAGPAAPSSPAAPAWPQQAGLHDAHLPPPPHLLTPPPDANVCQPRSICEEIRLTPQIRGSPLPAPPGPPQVEPLPQAKGPPSAPRSFSRPLSRASVMEGSPVTLEVEVSGHPEPTLTGWVASNHLHGNTAA